MNDMTPSSAERAEKLQGMGCRRKRVEDVRFVQGKGNYVDDLKLPGMLYGDLVRSPHAHAKIKSVDTKAAAAAEAIMAPAADARGPVEYRKHVGGIMVTRALQRAASRAK